MSRSGRLFRVGQALAAVVVLCLVGTSLGAPAKGKPKSHGVSRESFNLISEGMTRKDVEGIIGHAGKEKAQFENPTYGRVTTLIWGDEKKNIRVNFSRGRAIGKYETGLNKGKK